MYTGFLDFVNTFKSYNRLTKGGGKRTMFVTWKVERKGEM